MRLITKDDLALTLKWRNQEEIRRYFFYDQKISMDQHCNWFNIYQSQNDGLIYLITEPKLNPNPIGQVGVRHIDHNKHEAEYGWCIIGEAYARGRSIMRRASLLMFSYLSDELGIQALYLQVKPENLIARRVYEQLGFVISHSSDNKIFMRCNLS